MGKLTMNGTEVTTQKVDGKTVITINTSDADVVVNGVTLWSKYDKPEYMDIPEPLRTFIFGKNDFVKSEDDKVTADCWLPDSYTCATFYIPKNKRKSITVRLDLINSLEELETEYIRNWENVDEETADKLVAQFKKLFQDIEDAIASAGYKLGFSHSTEDLMHGWWDVMFDLKDWNEEAFVDIWTKFENFNKRLREVLDKYYY